MGLQPVLRLGEVGHLEIDECQFVIEDGFFVRVHEPDLADHSFVLVRVIKEKIQNADGVNCLQLKVPVSSHSLFPDRKCRIENAAILEKILFRLLKFHDEFLALLILAVNVKNGLPLSYVREMFVLQIGDFFDVALFLPQQFAEKVQQQVFVRLLPEQPFEPEIREGIDVSVPYHGGNSLCFVCGLSVAIPV